MSIMQELGGLTEIPTRLFNSYRLLILLHLKSNNGLRFHVLKNMLDISSDGNLASHLRALEQEGCIEHSSELEGRKLKTIIKITSLGEQMLDKTIEQMRIVVSYSNN